MSEAEEGAQWWAHAGVKSHSGPVGNRNIPTRPHSAQLASSLKKLYRSRAHLH